MIGRHDFFLFVPALLFPYTRLSSYLLLFLCLTSLILDVPSDVEDTRTFPIAILNGTCFFPPAQLQVHNVYSERKT